MLKICIFIYLLILYLLLSKELFFSGNIFNIYRYIFNPEIKQLKGIIYLSFNISRNVNFIDRYKFLTAGRCGLVCFDQEKLQGILKRLVYAREEALKFSASISIKLVKMVK